MDDRPTLNNSGVYACCYDSTETLQYLMEQPNSQTHWPIWMVGAAESFATLSQTQCATMLLTTVPENKKMKFLVEVIWRLHASGNPNYHAFFDVLAPHILDLPSTDKTALLTNVRHQHTNSFFGEKTCALVESALLNEKIKLQLPPKSSHIQTPRFKKM